MDSAAIVSSLRRASPVKPVEVLYATAFALFQRESFGEAATVFRAMLKTAPTDERAWLGLGECHEQVEQLLLALELFGAGSVACHPSARCTLARARVLRKLDRADDAQQALHEAWKIASAQNHDELLDIIDLETQAKS
jgi:cytochrome c-type biogenesis protein CcmH/NrfG